MLIKIVKCGSVAGLLLASMSWHSGTNYQLLLDVAVCMSVIVMVQQAVRSREYSWAALLAGTVLVLNPVVPVFTPAGNLILFLFLFALSPIVIGFGALIDATATLYPNLITEPYLQGISWPKSRWITVSATALWEQRSVAAEEAHQPI